MVWYIKNMSHPKDKERPMFSASEKEKARTPVLRFD
jgi:hypothetical protein